MGKFLAIVGGLIAMAGGVLLVALTWGPYFKVLVLGAIPPVLFFGGLIALIAGISSIKDAARTKKLEAEAKAEKT
jgi:ABC-type antimicrobial peptide transport system permease subunit